jgi:uncharacterized protein YneF (UPF0154 family)
LTSTVLWLQELHLAYLERYYSSNAPGASSSWLALEARAAATPGFTRFVSPSLHVRVFSAIAILFWVRGGQLVACSTLMCRLHKNCNLAADSVGYLYASMSAAGKLMQPSPLHFQ